MDGHRAAATLGVGPRATKEEIRRAFRDRAKQTHPDAPGAAGSQDAFIALQLAVDVLLAVSSERPPSSPVRTAPGPSNRWMHPTADRPPSTVMVTDLRKPTVGRARRPISASPPGRAVETVTRDARGRSFDDHLAAALADRS